MASIPPLRVLVVEPDDARHEALAAVLAGLGALAASPVRARTQEEALAALRGGGVDVCLAPSERGPDLAAGLTLRLARAAAFVPVVAVVDDPAAGLEALRDEGAADYLLRDRMGADDVARALLVSRARREAVEAFRNEQVVLAATLEAADVAVVELDEAGLIVRASAGVGPVLGRGPRGLVGRRYGALFDGEVAEAVGALLDGRTPPERRAALRFRRYGEAHGEPVAVEWVVSPLPTGGAVAVGHPEAAQAEETEALVVLQHVVDALPLAVLSTDARGRVRYIGGAALEAFGVTTEDLEEDLEGASAFALFGEAPSEAAYVRRALAGEPNEALLERSGCRFRARFVPLLDRLDRPAGMAMVACDVTEREENR